MNGTGNILKLQLDKVILPNLHYPSDLISLYYLFLYNICKGDKRQLSAYDDRSVKSHLALSQFNKTNKTCTIYCFQIKKKLNKNMVSDNI